MQNMSDPIDFIDLTVDSPEEKYLKLRNKNDENISNNSTTKSKKYKSSKRQLADIYDSVIEISIGSTYKDVEAMEIIDVDNIKPLEQNAICCVNDSIQGNSIMLTCPICFEQLSSKMEPMSTRCGHIFCAQCIKQALRVAKKCPTCKRASKFQSCTAVGMAAGLLLGKVLSRTSIVKTQNFELEAPVKKNTNKNDKEQCKEDPIPTTSFEAMNSDFKNNINDLAVEKKYNKNLQKVFYSNNNHTLHNISVEDNIGYNLSSKIYLEDRKKEKKDSIWQFSESSSIKREPFYVTELECNAEYDTRDNDYSKTINTNNPSKSNKKNTLRQVTVHKSIELSETFNNLSNDFYNNNTIYENLPNIKPSMINLNILPSYLVNASSMATCNDTFLQFEDEEDDKIVSCKSFDEFDEIDVLSSTKQNDLEN